MRPTRNIPVVPPVGSSWGTMTSNTLTKTNHLFPMSHSLPHNRLLHVADFTLGIYYDRKFLPDMQHLDFKYIPSTYGLLGKWKGITTAVK